VVLHAHPRAHRGGELAGDADALGGGAGAGELLFAAPPAEAGRPAGGRLAAPTGRLARAAALLVAAAGCGNYSTEDIAFVEALPAPASLRVKLPPAAQALCAPPGEAPIWPWARPTGSNINAGVDAILALVDAVRSATPSHRDRDARRWGPFDDGKHPGVRIQVVMTRSWSGSTPSYAYSFEAMRPAVPGSTWTPVLVGQFAGGSARTGSGSLAIRFGALRALGMSDNPSDPAGDISIHYDKTGDPQTLDLDLAAQPDGSFGLASFRYGFAGYADGFGIFDYAFRNGAGDLAEASAHFDPSAAGRADVALSPAAAPGLRLLFSLCWDAAGCLTALDDPLNVAGLCAARPCQINWAAGAAPPPPPYCPVVR
jgi:hypothetical protein